MKCIVCGCDVSGRGKCPNCGFSVYYITGQETEEIREKIKTLAEKHRSKCLDHLFISLYRCLYETEKEQLRVKEEEWIPLLSGKDLISGTEWWLDRKFTRQRLDRPVRLQIKMRWFGEEKTKEVEVKAPVIFDFWRVGVKVSDESHIQILLGRKDCCESSEKIAVFENI